MKFTLILCITAFSFQMAVAQLSSATTARNITNASGSRASKAKISARITLDGNYQTGNTAKANFSGTGFISAIDSIKEFSANVRFVYGENNKTANQKEYLVGIQYDYHPLSDFSPFVRCEFIRNQFKQIAGRYSGLVGAKYRYFVKQDKIDYSVSVALLYDFDHYTADAELPDKERIRISVRPKFKHDLTENIRLVIEIYYKPNLANFNDYMIYWNSNLNIRVFKNVLFRMSYENEYNSRPATNRVRKTDALLLAGLGIEL